MRAAAFRFLAPAIASAMMVVSRYFTQLPQMLAVARSGCQIGKVLSEDAHPCPPQAPLGVLRLAAADAGLADEAACVGDGAPLSRSQALPFDQGQAGLKQRQDLRVRPKATGPRSLGGFAEQLTLQSDHQLECLGVIVRLELIRATGYVGQFRWHATCRSRRLDDTERAWSEGIARPFGALAEDSVEIAYCRILLVETLIM